MDVQLAGLFWSTRGAELKHFALKLDCASPSPHSAPAWPRNETARGSAHHWKHSRVSEWHPCDGDATTTRIATVTRHKFPSYISILWWPQRCDRVLYGRIKNRERVQMLKSCVRPQAQASRGLWEPPAALRGFGRALRFIAPHTWLN